MDRLDWNTSHWPYVLSIFTWEGRDILVSEFPIWYALFLYFRPTSLYPSFQFGMPCFYISISPHCIRVSNLVCPVSIFPSHPTVSEFPILYALAVSIFPSHLTVSEFPILYALFLYFRPTPLYPSFQFGMPCFYISIPPHCIRVSNLVCPVSIFPSHPTVSEFPIWYALFLYFHPTPLYCESEQIPVCLLLPTIQWDGMHSKWYIGR